jgi:hypothetical protein
MEWAAADDRLTWLVSRRLSVVCQLLHCITPAETGGLSTVADGIAAALYMRKHSPAHFRLLATVPVDFHRKQI